MFSESTKELLRILLASQEYKQVGFDLYRFLFNQPTPADPEEALQLEGIILEFQDQIALDFGIPNCRLCHCLLLQGSDHTFCAEALGLTQNWDQTEFPDEKDWPDYKSPEQIAAEEEAARDAYYDHAEEEEEARNAQYDPESWEEEELSADDDLFSGTGQWARS